MNMFIKGQRVIYIPTHARENRNHPDCQHGVVKSSRDSTVLVLYDNAVMKMITGDEPYTAQSTCKEDLVLEMEI